MLLKETVEDPQMLKKIAGVLVPQEFTRVDAIIDLVFAAAAEIRQDVEEAEVQEDVVIKKDKKTSQFVPADFHDACIHRIEKHLGRSLLEQTRATYSSPDGGLMVVCAVSRTHTRDMYWYAFHPHQKERLESAREAYVAYGCGSESTVLLIQFRDFTPWLEGMWITQLEDRFYWRVSVRQEGTRFLQTKKGV